MTITANDIKRLLAQKYYECIYVTECKTGKSYHEYGAIDFWAMADGFEALSCDTVGRLGAYSGIIARSVSIKSGSSTKVCAAVPIAKWRFGADCSFPSVMYRV